MADDQTPAARSWLDRHLWQIQPIRDLLMIAGVVGLVWLGYRLSVVTVPLLLAVALAYLFDPVVRRLLRLSWVSREGAAAAIIAVSVLVVVVPLGVGGAFAAVQGIQLASDVADGGAKLSRALEEKNRDNQAVQAAVPPGLWSWVRDVVLREREVPEHQTESDGEASEAEQAGDDPGVEAPAEVPGDGAAAASDPETDAPSEGTDAQQGASAEPNPDTSADAADPEESDRDSAGLLEELTREVVDQPPGTVDATSVKPSPSAVRASDGQTSDAAVLAINWVRNNAQAITQRALQTGAGAFEAFVSTVTSIALLGFNLFLTAFFFFFISVGYPRVVEFGRGLIPDAHKEVTLHLLTRFDAVIAGFIRGRLTIAFVQAIVFTLGYWLIGVPAPILLGVGVAVLSIVPYAALVGIPASIALLWLEGHTGFRGAFWWIIAAPLALYFIGQALDDYVWTPLIQGKSTGMDTPTILFATLAGGALMGVYGLLLAIPLAACIKILLQEIFWPRFKQWLAGEKPDFLPIGRE
ncbi:MAG: AI-2E family transporter [Phycisphaerales bacterium]